MPFDINHEAECCVNEIWYTKGITAEQAAELIARYMREAVLAAQTPGGVLMGKVPATDET